MTYRRAPGFRFDRGRLMVYTEKEVKIVHTWPNLETVRTRSKKSGWQPFIPRFRLLRPKSLPGMSGPDAGLGPSNVLSRTLDPAFEKLFAFLNFRRSIPPEIASAVEGFSNRQMTLLLVCKQREQVSELLVQNPALGFSLAHHEHFRLTWSDPLELAAKVSKMKQREIAKWLGFPGSQLWANILAKIPGEIVSLESILALRTRAGIIEVEKLLCHLRVLNAGAMALILSQETRRLTTAALLEEVATASEERTTPQVVHLIHEIVGLHMRMGTERDLTGFRSIDEVRRKQQDTVDELARYRKRLESEELPEPPLPGTEHIIPLVNNGQLDEEGEAQHHCVGCYGPLVAAGKCYIYRVMSPQRATLAIEKGPDGCWGIQQLYLSCNRPADQDPWKAVRDWLDRFSLSV